MSFGTKWETFNFSFCISCTLHVLSILHFSYRRFCLNFFWITAQETPGWYFYVSKLYPLCEFTNLLNITKIQQIKRLSRSYLPNVLVVLNFLFNAVVAWKKFLPTKCIITFGPMPVSSWNTISSCCNVGHWLQPFGKRFFLVFRCLTLEGM